MILLEEIKTVQSYAQYGTILGFPQCCIKEFIADCCDNDESKVFDSSRSNRKLHGTGYIPCKKCNSLYSTKILIKRMNALRLVPKKFQMELIGTDEKGTKHWTSKDRLDNISESGKEQVGVNHILTKVVFKLQ